MFAFRVLMEKFGATSELFCLCGSRLGVSNSWPLAAHAVC